MIITFKDKEGNELVQLRSTSMDWQLYTKASGVMKDGKLVNPKNGRPIKNEWVPQPCYASSAAYAFSIGIETFCKLRGNKYEAFVDGEKIMKSWTKFLRDLKDDVFAEIDEEG